MTRLTLYTRPGCHLCEAMKAVVRELKTVPVTLEEVDISGHPGLERRFGTEVPVLACGEQVVARIRTTRATLLATLQGIERGRETDA